MRSLPLVALLSVLPLLPACKGQQGAGSSSKFGSAEDPVFFSLERTPCFGKCPAYTATIKGDGSATYVGRSNAPRVGSHTGKVDQATMQLLLDRARKIGFFSFEDSYDGAVTDLPSTIIRVNAEGKDKKVVGRYKTPEAFKPFAAYADSLLAPVQWVKVADQEQH